MGKLPRDVGSRVRRRTHSRGEPSGRSVSSDLPAQSVAASGHPLEERHASHAALGEVRLDRTTANRSLEQVLHASVDVSHPKLGTGITQDLSNSLTDLAELASSVWRRTGAPGRSGPDLMPIETCETLEEGRDLRV